MGNWLGWRRILSTFPRRWCLWNQSNGNIRNCQIIEKLTMLNFYSCHHSVVKTVLTKNSFFYVIEHVSKKSVCAGWLLYVYYFNPLIFILCMRFLNVVIKTFSLDKITFKMTQTTMLSTNLSYSRNVTSLLSTAYLSNVIKVNFKMCNRGLWTPT